MGLFRAVTIAAAFAVCAVAQSSDINQFAGSGLAGAGYSGDGAAAANALLNMPYSVAADSSGNVYIADFGNHVVREVNSAGIITTFAGTGTAGTAGAGGYAISAQLTGPTGVAVDSAGNVYISDGPTNRILEVLPSGIMVQFAGIATGGFSGDGGAATSAALNYPSAVAVDSKGNVYIADTGNHRIRRVASGLIATFAGNGTPAFVGDTGPATSASLNSPQGVAVDPSGNVYISDTGNQRVREVTGGTINTIAGNGTAGYTGDKGAATSAMLDNPHGLAADSSGDVYVADTGNSVIRRIATGLISTVAGTGVAGFFGDGNLATLALLNGPYGVGVDPTGGFTYIADTGNNEVRVIANVLFTGVIPHFAVGDSYTTGFYVVNTSSQPAGLTITSYSDAGVPVNLPFTTLTSTATQTGSMLSDTIPAYGSAYYEAGVPTNSTLLEGSAFIQSNSSIVVQTLFRHLSAAGIYYEAAVSSTPGATEIELAFDGTTFAPTGAQIYTGIAISNTDPANQATITCTARNNAGATIANAVSIPVLNPLGHYAAYNFPALVGQRGTLDCTSTTKIGAIALRFLGNDALSSLPVILK